MKIIIDAYCSKQTLIHLMTRKDGAGHYVIKDGTFNGVRFKRIDSIIDWRIIFEVYEFISTKSIIKLSIGDYNECGTVGKLIESQAINISDFKSDDFINVLLPFINAITKKYDE